MMLSYNSGFYYHAAYHLSKGLAMVMTDWVHTCMIEVMYHYADKICDKYTSCVATLCNGCCLHCDLHDHFEDKVNLFNHIAGIMELNIIESQIKSTLSIPHSMCNT